MLKSEVSHLADALIKFVYGIDTRELAIVHASNIIAYLGSVDYVIVDSQVVSDGRTTE